MISEHLTKGFVTVCKTGGRLEDDWFGPYYIAEIFSKGTVQLKDKTGKMLKTKYNMKNLKPYIRLVSAS